MVAREGFSLEFGARESEYTFERLIALPLSQSILKGKTSADGQVSAVLSNCKITFKSAHYPR